MTAPFNVAAVHAVKPDPDFQIGTHISLKNRYVFFQVSKAASSTIIYHLQSVEFEGSHFKVQDPNNKLLSPHLSPYQLNDNLLFEVMRGADFRRVAFVRNPFTRLLSCYLHRIVEKEQSASAKAYRRATAETETPSFRRFVEVVCDQPSHEMERHWRVQSDEILAGVVEHDFIGRFENLRADLKAMGNLLFNNDVFDEDALAEVNVSPMVTGSDKRLVGYYTDDLVHRVTRRFANDFELFGYPRTLPI